MIQKDKAYNKAYNKYKRNRQNKTIE